MAQSESAVAALGSAVGDSNGSLARRILGEAREADRDDMVEVLARAAAAGSTLAVELLVETVDRYALARSAVRRYLLDEAAVDDVTQDTLITVARAVGTFRGDAKFTTWLHQLARNRAVDHLRRTRATQALDDEDQEPTPAQRMSSLVVSRQTVRALLEELPDQYRDAVVLRDVEQLPYGEIAERLGRNLNTREVARRSGPGAARRPGRTEQRRMTAAVRRIGCYAVEDVVGAGAFATVYRAVDERLGTTVAIKVLADNHCLDPDTRARFIDEGRALRRVDSPHVVRVYDAGETEQTQPYLVLDYADHGTLADRVAARRAAGWRPTADDVRRVVAELAEAMEALHAADLVHRDLSPGNVLLRSQPGWTDTEPTSTLLDPDERLVVADLGLSKDLARSSGLTVASGTDGFRPPEQQGGPAQITHRADLWALSALLFWLLTGEPPAEADPRASRRTLERGLAGTTLSPDLARPILVSLEEDPARRHNDVSAWRTAVEEVLDASAAAAGAEAVPREPWHRRVVVRRVALVAAGLALGVAGAILVSSLGGDDPWTTRQLGGGRVTVAATAGDAQLTLVGPAEAPVGTTVSFEASAEGVDQWVWLMPDGRVYVDSPTAEIRTQSPGVARITLLGTTESGERLEVVHELHVSDSDG